MSSWSLFSTIRFEPLRRVNANNDRGGNFFKNVTNNLPPVVVKCLKRLQIFGKLDKNNKQRKELDNCCFFYALKQTGEQKEEILNKIRLKINTKSLTNSEVENFCMEFKIYLKMNYIDDSSKKKSKISNRIAYKERGEKRRKYFDVPEDKVEHKHLINLYNKDYFTEERTPFTSYYIKNIGSLDPKCYNKLMLGQKLKTGKTKLIMSSKLVRSLMKTNHFKPITFLQFGIISTIYSNDIPKKLYFPYGQ